MFTQLPLSEYLKKMASTPFPSPKGGSALAITSAMGAALVKMCCQVSEKRNPEEPRYQELLAKADLLMNQFLKLADEDTETVFQMIQAHKIPKDTPEHCETIEESYVEAAETLFHIGERTQELIELAKTLSPLCASSCLVDLYIVEALAKAVWEAATHAAKDNYQVIERAGCPLELKGKE